MSVRSTAGLLAAGLLVILSSPAPAGAAETHKGNLITTAYPVADLVIPLNQPSRQEVKTQEEKLMKLLACTVCPRSWAEMGGEGTMEYFPLTMTLVVRQTADVQEQVADLLASLRRQQDNEVSVEVRFVEVSTEVMEQLGIQEKEGGTPGMAVLDETQVKLLIEGAQADRRTHVMQAPKITVFNGQQAALDLSEKQTFVVGIDFQDKDGKQMPQPKTKTVMTGLQMSVLPVVSPCNRYVTLQLGVREGRADADPRVAFGPAWSKKALHTSEGPNEPRYTTLEVEKTLKLASGSTALLTGWTQHREVRNQVGPPVLSKVPYVNRLFRNVSYGQETMHTLVLVTPRVLTRQEEAERLPMPRVEACVPASEGNAAQQQWAKPPAERVEEILRQASLVETCQAPAGMPRVCRDERWVTPNLMYVNKHSFELSYQLENVGPSKVKSIEVWWTHGGGKWARYPEEVKPGGPVPITVQSDGRYGFTLVPRSGAGLCGKRPAEGDEPHVWVEVDTQAPALEIHNVDLAGLEQGKETITLSWKADDKNLRADSVDFYWSETKDGPWHLIARELKAEGKYDCPCKALPYQCYLRATATDLAGNVAEAVTPGPVNIDLRVPSIRDVKVNVRK
jgi:hypothetical protein